MPVSQVSNLSTYVLSSHSYATCKSSINISLCHIVMHILRWANVCFNFSVSVETSDTCTSTSTLRVSNSHGTLSSAIARQTGCGSINVPWVITLKEGQQVDIKLVDVLAVTEEERHIDSTLCSPIG